MSGAHLHLFLTHIPVVGVLFGLLILAYGLLAKRQEALSIALGIFVLTGLAAVAVYFTGEAAGEAIEGLPGIAEAVLEQHEEAGLIALVASVILGGIALAQLLIFRYQVPRMLAGAMLVLALAVSGVMGWTANLGGQINHPEIRSTTTAAGAYNVPPEAPDEDD